MRILLYLWLVPFVILALWFGLSANDIHFGIWFLSRDMHDLVMKVYAETLGVEVSELPGLLWRALLIDGAIIGLIIAIRKRAVLIPWLRQLVAPGVAVADPDSPAK